MLYGKAAAFVVGCAMCSTLMSCSDLRSLPEPVDQHADGGGASSGPDATFGNSPSQWGSSGGAGSGGIGTSSGGPMVGTGASAGSSADASTVNQNGGPNGAAHSGNGAPPVGPGNQPCQSGQKRCGIGNAPEACGPDGQWTTD